MTSLINHYRIYEIKLCLNILKLCVCEIAKEAIKLNLFIQSANPFLHTSNVQFIYFL